LQKRRGQDDGWYPGGVFRVTLILLYNSLHDRVLPTCPKNGVFRLSAPARPRTCRHIIIHNKIIKNHTPYVSYYVPRTTCHPLSVRLIHTLSPFSACPRSSKSDGRLTLFLLHRNHTTTAVVLSSVPLRNASSTKYRLISACLRSMDARTLRLSDDLRAR
jgi:hypothetical protein